MLIQAITGKENFPTGSSNFHLFTCGTRRFQGPELHIGQAAKGASAVISVVGMPQRLPAAPGCRIELGEWTNGTYDCPEQFVLKIFGSRKDANVSAPTHATAYIQVRETAALNRVHFRTMAWQRGQFSNVFVEGRFDVITPDEARALGVVIQPHFIPHVEYPGKWRVFRLEQVSPELRGRVEVQPVVVTNSQGEEVELPRSRRRRGIDL